MLDIDLIRQHLRLDTDADDALLAQYCAAAYKQVELYTHRPLISAEDPRAICDDEANMPADIVQYVLLTIGDMYRTRENEQDRVYTSYFKHLLDGYIDYYQED